MNENEKKKETTSGCKVFYVGHYDPSIPHPRKLISKNYGLLAFTWKPPYCFKTIPKTNLISG